MPPRKSPTDAALLELRAFGLRYPGAHTKSPWPGHLDLAVNDKTFAYLSIEGAPFSLSCKLPSSSDDALALPFVTPTAYGLGKSGWVTATLPAGPVPIELFKAWIEESYRAQAPKRLSRQLEQAQAEAEPSEAVARKRAPRKRSPRKPAPPPPRAKQAAPRAAATRKPAQRKGSAPKRRAAGRV